MTHEPECGYAANATWEGCMCKQFRAAYKRGREDAAKDVNWAHVSEIGEATPLTLKLVTAARGGEQE